MSYEVICAPVAGAAVKQAPIYSARQVPQCVGSTLQLFPLPSERRHDQKSGNESSGRDFRSTRPSPAVNDGACRG